MNDDGFGTCEIWATFLDGVTFIRYWGLQPDRATAAARDMFQTGRYRRVYVRDDRTGFVTNEWKKEETT